MLTEPMRSLLSSLATSSKFLYNFTYILRGRQTKGDILCEMRFHVSNNEVDKLNEERQKKREAEGKEDEEDEEEELLASKLFNDRILAKANIGNAAGSVIASIHDMPMLIPRGNYTLDFFSSFCKLHGKTHDYKLAFKDINKVFLLQKPDGVHMVLLLQLD